MYLRKKLLIFLASTITLVLSVMFSNGSKDATLSGVSLVDLTHADTTSGGGSGGSDDGNGGSGAGSSSC